ncbi:GvpL/GvpF family gas vesicle protein [Streptomyces sp. NPDC047022]|uniref:GvpL/GvpF family gas vesicle protein n=1 Tax=Streptomyces sp. NPDC047022 TaxID=3155737 RepID=UPI0033C75D29
MTPLRYVYAVCRPLCAPLQAQLTGVAGAPARQLEHHGLVAVVSLVPAGEFGEEGLGARSRDPERSAVMSRAHQNIVDALTGVTTPLPLPPGMVFPDDSAVRVMIEEHEEDFRRALERLEGRVEWGVRVCLEAARASETESGRTREKAEEFACRLHEALSGQAEDSRLHTSRKMVPSGMPGRGVLDAVYLVPRSRSEEFVERVERVDRAEVGIQGVRVELTGPWAVYSFTGLEGITETTGSAVNAKNEESAEIAKTAEGAARSGARPHERRTAV